MTEISDKNLVESIRDGDYASYTLLFHRHYNGLCQYVYTILGSRQDTEDTVQELFLNLWTHRERLDIRGNVRGYIYRAARNLALNTIKNSTARREALLRAEFAELPESDDDPGPDDFRSALAACIDKMPARSREVLLLQRREGLSQKDIAESMGIAVQTVKNHLWLAIQKLRECLAGAKKSG